MSPRSSAALRGNILDSARRLFSERGYEATSLQDIASDVGCSKASLLYHFKNKDALLIELLTPVTRRLAGLLDEVAPLAGEALVRATVSALVDSAVEYRLEIRLLFEDLPRLPHRPELNLVPDTTERTLDCLTGRSRDPRARVAAWMVLTGIALTAGASADAALGDDVSDTDLRQGLIDAALRALGH
ncbi:helix-turn-helix domain-containing protein [Streptomyces sp. DSM 44915]|uniref:Helix-turn-helix domain-containing protein n=1 Tax=Streptomyces chisholmiae TaxID=3075540 RepID=A0ABU2JQL5_9ACTN|nr:helix-turn-helix domain-containing protein [Streptomyces sp. DSM 44915]MDT0267275.1 helix-turn-helix domain-containing protein [Streptomyces sp. DSM 44915]